MRYAIAEHFPAGTRISRPAGGFVLWVELPETVDGEQLFQSALEQGVSITPGTLFSATRRFRNYIRVSAGAPWSDRLEQAVATLGALARATA
jgi:DNA-binding transcriptional MocR family regulator